MSPVDVLIRVMQLQHVIVAIAENKFECTLHAIFLGGSILLPTSSPLPFRAISIRIVTTPTVLILIVISVVETQEKVCI